jgi:hypothetical protein
VLRQSRLPHRSGRRRYDAPMLNCSCLCGSVRFQVTEPLTEPTACHCSQCRRQSGHYFASANVAKSAIVFADEGALAWYPSSEKVRRGFCARCGSTLFWEPLHRDWTSVALGSVEGATGLRLARHIFVADKGDYYDIADGLPQNPH